MTEFGYIGTESFQGYSPKPMNAAAYGVKPVYLEDNWARKYKYLPSDTRFEGTFSERIAHLKRRGAGNTKINFWLINGKRIEAEEKIRKELIIYEEQQSLINETARIKKEKYDMIKQELENQRIEQERKQKEIENQRIEQERKQKEMQNQRIEIQKETIPQITNNDVLTIGISSAIPLAILAFLLINSRNSKK